MQKQAAERLAKKYGINFEYKLFYGGFFVNRNGIFEVITIDMPAAEIEQVMQGFISA